MHPLVEQARALPLAERLQIVGQIWDDIASSPEPLTLDQAETSEIKRRLDEYRKDPSIAIDQEEFWRRVDKNGE